jgi:hypothetical protein
MLKSSKQIERQITMSTYKRKIDFFETNEGEEVMEMLQAMCADATYNTESSYSSKTELHPDNLISFKEKHVDYLRNHPTTNPFQYLSNLRLMTRIR